MIPAIKKDKMVWVYADPYNTRRWPKVYMPYSELYPLKLYQFGNLLLPGPNNTHGYLTRVYDDYMTPKIEKGHHSL
jgi:phosphorylcholine metabolism protein LicD